MLCLKDEIDGLNEYIDIHRRALTFNILALK